MKDHIWYREKVKSIKRQKRALRHIQDPEKVKKIKADLKREQRAAKRSEKNSLREWIKSQISNEGIQ